MCFISWELTKLMSLPARLLSIKGRMAIVARIGSRPGERVGGLGRAFVLPALAAMQGEAAQWQVVRVPAAHPTAGAGPRAEVVPALLQDSQADVLSVKGSADLAHFAAGEWLILRRAGVAAAPVGGELDLLVWPRP